MAVKLAVKDLLSSESSQRAPLSGFNWQLNKLYQLGRMKNTQTSFLLK